jgi:hypothetical protein
MGLDFFEHQLFLLLFDDQVKKLFDGRVFFWFKMHLIDLNRAVDLNAAL